MMGIIILLLLASIEISLAVYCIATKSVHRVLRSCIRIGEFATFAILTLLSVIEWSFRWELLAVVLSVWAIIGAVSLILLWMARRKNKQIKIKKFGIVSNVIKTIAILLLISISLTPALVFPQYKLPKVTGKHKVKTATYTYKDDSRVESFKNNGEKRKVNVEFWFPAETAGTYPLVVFSHGAFGMKSSNTSTYTELASNGYVVCSIDHPYHSLVTKDFDGNTTIVNSAFLQEVLDVNNGVYDDQTKFNIEKKWMKLRTDDMNFVIDTIKKKAQEKESDEFFKHIDTSKIGLMGHSLGGAASVQLGRDRSDISAVINLDADLLGEAVGFEDGKYILNDKVYPVPFLSIYSDVMKQRMDSITDPAIKLPQKVIAATAPDAFVVYMSGTNHMSLTDLPFVSPFLVKLINGSVKGCDISQTTDKNEVIKNMNYTILEFYNCFLKDAGDFKVPSN